MSVSQAPRANHQAAGHRQLALRESYGLFIGGDWLRAANGATKASVNPASEEPLAEVAAAGAEDVDRAVRAARRGYEKYWRKLRPTERAKYVYRLARGVAERSRELALVQAVDAGTPVGQRGGNDASEAGANLFYHAGWADKLDWAVRSRQRARPLGVVGAIVSCQAPLIEAVGKLGPALACGNTIVIKPAESAPLCALALATAVVEAGLPPGVVNVVTGDVATGTALAEHGDVDKLSFTGSRDVGTAVRRAAAGTRKSLTLEFASSPVAVVFAGADLDAAATAVLAALRTAHCSPGFAGPRVLAHENIAEQMAQRLRARMEALHVGDPLEPATDLGPVVSSAAREGALEAIRAAASDGASVFEWTGELPARGYFLRATLLGGARPQDPVPGPAIALSTFATLADAVSLAGEGGSGASATVWTDDGGLALRAARALRAASVGWNGRSRLDPSAPFGGFARAGFGRQGGLRGLLEYLQP